MRASEKGDFMTSETPAREPLDENMAFTLVRATEAVAVAASRWIGRGDRITANHATIPVMYEYLNRVGFSGRIVVSKDFKRGGGTLLDTGTVLGTGIGPTVDLLADPIDGGNLLVHGRPGALSVAAVAPEGMIWSPQPAVYMEKLVVDREVAPKLVPECLDAPVAWTLALIARVKDISVQDLSVFVLDRPRHADLIDEIRQAGARVILRLDGDIAGALHAATPNAGVDLLMGIGGVTEGVLSACAVRALEGAMLGRLTPQSDTERAAVAAAGLDTRKIMNCSDMVRTNEVFFAATGITDGAVLEGVHFTGRRAITESLILRGETHTMRVIRAEHLKE